MKQCISCKLSKELSEFGKYSKSKDGLQARCKSCKREYDNQYYSLSEKRKEEVKSRNQVRMQVVKAYVRAYLSKHPCVDCGQSDIRVLDFDHVADNKEANVSRLVGHGNSINRVQREIDKCEVRCANCHRIKTHERAGW